MPVISGHCPAERLPALLRAGLPALRHPGAEDAGPGHGEQPTAITSPSIPLLLPQPELTPLSLSSPFCAQMYTQHPEQYEAPDKDFMIVALDLQAAPIMPTIKSVGSEGAVGETPPAPPISAWF